MKTIKDENLLWLYIDNIKNLGTPKFSKLYFSGIDNAIAELSEEQRRIIYSGEWKNRADELIQYMHENGISVVFYNDDNYPQNLKNIPSPPAIIYYIGDISLADCDSMAVVGSRRPTNYGKTCTKMFCTRLAENGICIVSGMAEGVDSYAHNFALECGGKTVAVLGGGVDYVYPTSNRDLYERIKKDGLIISEYPLSTRPQRQNFPSRNRIISGISKNLLVVEATLKSGTMSTVEHALDQGREVFAVPGNITSAGSEGTNALILGGATMALTPEQVLENFGIELKIPEKQVFKGSNELEDKIIKLLLDESRTAEYLFQALDEPAAEISTALMMLEISDIIEKNSAKEYSIIKGR